MRILARHILLAVLIAGMLDMPAWAASQKPLGLVIQAQSAQVDNAVAAIGTTVYSGDAVETQSGGSLRLRLGSSQLYLMASSAATLAQNAATPQVHVLRGTVGMSTIAPDQLELQTPLGIVRAANGQAAYGQVRIVSPQELVITSYRGDLLIDRDGEERTIEAGKSYDVTLEANAEPASGNANIVSVKNNHLLLKVIVVAAEGITAYLLWQEWSESCYKFTSC